MPRVPRKANKKSTETKKVSRKVKVSKKVKSVKSVKSAPAILNPLTKNTLPLKQNFPTTMSLLRPVATKPMLTSSATIKTSPTLKSGDACHCNFNRLVFGFILVLIGLFYLAGNFGLLPTDSLLSILWPAIILVLGVLMLDGKSRWALAVGLLTAASIAAAVYLLVNLIGSCQSTFNFNDDGNKQTIEEPIVNPVANENLPTTTEATPSSTLATITPAFVLDNIVPNQIVKSPLSISGSALGSWFFEGSFPVKVVDEANKVLGQSIAQAQGEWTTTSPVTFTSNLKFKSTTSTRGLLIFERDNPSGLGNSEKFMVPVRFSAQGGSASGGK